MSRSFCSLRPGSERNVQWAPVVTPLAEDDRALRAGRCQLHHPEVLTGCEVGIHAPPQAPVEALGAIDVGHRQDDDLELHFDHPSARVPGCVFTAHLRAAHRGLHGLVVSGIIRAHLMTCPAHPMRALEHEVRRLRALLNLEGAE